MNDSIVEGEPIGEEQKIEILEIFEDATLYEDLAA